MIPDLEKDYLYFTRVVKRDLGLDLALYKETQMKRRILSFIVKKQYITFGEFFKHLKKDAVLLDEFISLITINVSSFFRNRNRWDALENKYFQGCWKIVAGSYGFGVRLVHQGRNRTR